MDLDITNHLRVVKDISNLIPKQRIKIVSNDLNPFFGDQFIRTKKEGKKSFLDKAILFLGATIKKGITKVVSYLPESMTKSKEKAKAMDLLVDLLSDKGRLLFEDLNRINGMLEKAKTLVRFSLADQMPSLKIKNNNFIDQIQSAGTAVVLSNMRPDKTVLLMKSGAKLDKIEPFTLSNNNGVIELRALDPHEMNAYQKLKAIKDKA